MLPVIHLQAESSPMSSFIHTFEEHAGSSFARQLALADLLGERSWSVDLDEGTIRFGDDLAFPVQVLGTQSFQDNTWLWGWANKAADLPSTVLAASEQLRTRGSELQIAELTEAKFPLEAVSEHMLAMLCSGMVPGTAYFRGPYVDHARSTGHFLKQQGFSVSKEGQVLKGTRSDAELKITFDGQGRIAEIGSTLHPAEEKKPWWKVW